ncbi:cytosolic protein [Halalkalibacillus sediminis]|uniref:Cytosolic protein n=1 Tax=Halalkalibacillus sediminis TaxID=2018042 RepID=A0A2I0QUX1_9BACI|nr:cytosolic protein [Halalkalibacillus sediminis]PKR78099.1 cytosolic protein [Halalkalibacillus sediminis]
MSNNKDSDDFKVVEVQNQYQGAQEFPEGTYGQPIHKDEPLKAKRYNPNRRHYSAFNYENKQLHHDMPRKYPGAHNPQDAPNEKGITDPEKE